MDRSRNDARDPYRVRDRADTSPTLGRLRRGFGASRARAILAGGTLLAALATACSESEPPPTDIPPEEDVLGISEHAPTGAPSVSGDGLVASYDMTTLTDDGLLRDFSGRGLHGSIEGTSTTESPRGGARSFGGASTDLVDLPDASDFDLDGPLSVVARFRVDLAGQHQHVVACDNKFVLWLSPADRVRFANTIGDGAETDAPLTSGEWHVVVAVFRGVAGDAIDDSNLEIWIDGARAPVGFRNIDGITPPFVWQDAALRATNACFLGVEAHGGDPRAQNLPFHGAIDEVLVFGRALTEAEIAALSASP